MCYYEHKHHESQTTNPSLKLVPQQHQFSPTPVISYTPSFAATIQGYSQYLLLFAFCVGKEKKLVKRVQKGKFSLH